MKPRLSALKYSLWLLERRDYSTREIQSKLLKKEYSAEEIEETIERLEFLKFLDDERFAKRFTENQHRLGKSGNRLIYLKLLKKGISQEIIKKYLVDVDQEAVELLALKWLKKKQGRENLKARLFQYLAGRGFAYDEIKTALESEAVKLLLVD